MREILFKAKTKNIVRSYNYGKDDGVWVKGYVYNDVGIWLIKQFEYDRADYIAYEVDPDTICRYTGLIGKNGKKWEKDIFEASDGEFIQRYIIEWDEDALQWYAECITTPDFSMSLCEFKEEEIDIIGNAIDNPELLE